MGQITSLFFYKVLAQVDATHDRRALLEEVGLATDAAVDPARMIPAEDYYRFLERIARQDAGAVDLPLRVGASMRCDEYGAFGLAWKAAPTLRGSFERAARYGRVLTSVSRHAVEETPEGVYFHLHRAGERRLGLRLSNEATIASALAISREVCSGEVQPLAVCFRHPAPGAARVHEAWFGCPVYFDADRDAFLISHAAAQASNRLGDEGISDFFDRHLEQELARFEDDASLERRVCLRVSQALSEGVPRMSDIAAGLGMSARTLQRRLAERDHSYQSLVDEARRELAERLLRETAYPLAEVAFLTGFSEQSAFNRAFRRWRGQTPRAWRLQAR